MNVWHDVSVGPKAPDVINVITECPKGSSNKYEVDKETGLVKLDRVLFSPLFYPGDYGMIPRTYGDDHDPLDALVLVTHPTLPGTLLEARPVGVMHMIDQGEGDDKILAVPIADPRWKHVDDLEDVPEPIRNEIAHFFSVYKDLEKKKVEVTGWGNAQKAREVIEASMAAYTEKFPK